MASSNDSGEVTTVQDVLKILPKHEKPLQVKMQDSRNRPSVNSPSYHTLRYGFKPASINSDEPATLELAQDGQVTIKAPNVGGSICTFKGHRRPHVKECLMVIDNRTGEVVLQKLTDNITVKATRTMAGTSGNNSDNNNVSNLNNSNNTNNNTNGVTSQSTSATTSSLSTSNNSATNNTNINNHHNSTNSVENGTTSISKNDGPQLSEESSDSSDDDSSSSSGSSSSSSSSSSNDSSPNNDGFTF